MQWITKNIADNKIKEADKAVMYFYLISFAYLVIAMFLAFGISRAFPLIVGIEKNVDPNFATTYIPLICTVGTLISIFNQASIGMLLVEGKVVINTIRGIASSLLTLLF